MSGIIGGWRGIVTDLLVRKFVKNYDKINNSAVRENYGMLSSIVGIVCNVLLCLAKFAIGTIANSISIISDGFNNLSDCASCVVTIFGYKMAAKPADKDHPFGHGRIEYLTSLVIAMVIMVVGFELFRNSIGKIMNPGKVEFSYIALVVLILSIAVKVWMGIFNRKLGKRINSGVMLATSKDSFSDVYATFATLIALVASIWTDAPLDGIMGIVVSLFILISGYGIIKETVDQLLGQPADEGLVNDIKELVSENPYSLGMHDLIIHSYGPGNLIGSVHIEVDSCGDIMEIHDAIDELERNIFDDLNVRITIHMDPIEQDNEYTNLFRDKLLKVLCEVNQNITMHDFRIVSGPSHTNLVFDLVIPYDCDMTESYIKSEIDRRLSEEKEKIYTVITFDKSFI